MFLISRGRCPPNFPMVPPGSSLEERGLQPTWDCSCSRQPSTFRHRLLFLGFSSSDPPRPSLMEVLDLSVGEVLECRTTLSGTRVSLWKADSFMVELMPLLGVLFTKACKIRNMISVWSGSHTARGFTPAACRLGCHQQHPTDPNTPDHQRSVPGSCRPPLPHSRKRKSRTWHTRSRGPCGKPSHKRCRPRRRRPSYRCGSGTCRVKVFIS